MKSQLVFDKVIGV